MHISHYGFVCPVRFSNEKYIRERKKRNSNRIIEKKILQVFVNNSQILPI